MLAILIKMLPLALLSLAGFALCRLRVIDARFTRQLSLVMLHYLYPALIISSILRSFTWESLLSHWMLPLGTGIILLVGWLMGAIAVRSLRHHPLPTRRSFHLVCTSSNYAFLPIIMVATLWGERAVALVVFASLGAELCLWTIGITSVAPVRGLNRNLLKQWLNMPMISLASACAILAGAHLMMKSGFTIESNSVTRNLLITLLDSCGMAGAATIPASAIICGARIAMLRTDKLFSPLLMGVSVMRLLVIPALCIAILLLMPLDEESRRVLLLIAVQPTAMANVSFAEAYGSDCEFAAGAVLLTHLLCLATIPVWLSFII